MLAWIGLSRTTLWAYVRGTSRRLSGSGAGGHMLSASSRTKYRLKQSNEGMGSKLQYHHERFSKQESMKRPGTGVMCKELSI